LTPRERVETLIAAARTVFVENRDAALVHALAVETGLPVEGVAFALERSLELSPTTRELDLLCERASPREHVVVVLAANVFTAPLRALAWALAASPKVTVRPSRRARVFVDALLDATPLAVERIESDDPEADVTRALREGSAVHVYGGRKTIESMAARNVAAELHGPGFGAIVAPAADWLAHANEIAADVALFDQRGCLSPRIGFVIGETERVADAMHAALDEMGARVPRGDLDPAELSEIARARDVGILGGRALEGTSHVILELDTPTIGPIGRVLPLVRCADEASAVRWLREQRELASIGTSLSIHVPGIRVAELGRMQSPPLDGPVDLRVL
jgi:hypothetical protein